LIYEISFSLLRLLDLIDQLFSKSHVEEALLVLIFLNLPLHLFEPLPLGASSVMTVFGIDEGLL